MSKKHILWSIVTTAIFLAIGYIFHIYDIWNDIGLWLYDTWNFLGLTFLQSGLGIAIHDLNVSATTTAVVTGTGVAAKAIVVKSAAKKSFLSLVKTIGYKKFFGSMLWVIVKRYGIDEAMKYFQKHSFEKFSDNLIAVAKIKMEDVKSSSPAKKIEGAFYTVGGAAFLYSIKGTWIGGLITAIIQKTFYGILTVILSFFTFIWVFIVTSFWFLLQFFLIIKILNYIEQFKPVKAIYSGFTWLFRLILKVIDFIFNTKIQGFIVRWSMVLDKKLAAILDRELSQFERIQTRRDRYINIVERIAKKRHELYLKRIAKKNNVGSYRYYIKKARKIISRKSSWEEKRDKLKNERLKRKCKRNANIRLRLGSKTRERYSVKRTSKL
ncbi:MAG: hypothetical protein U9Q66_01000, partial [Patescibacteria group bacterium]|nr:hypothetical protein [Patescibacteria group bacterium]